MPDKSPAEFDGVLQRAAEAAASEWRYAAPNEKFYEQFAAHIPTDTRAEIARGVRAHRVVVLHRPVFLTVIAIGWRRDYVVQYPDDQSFALIPMAEAPALAEVVHDRPRH